MLSYSHTFHACIILWQIFSEHEEFILRAKMWRNRGARAKASAGGLSRQGSDYLKFMRPSRVKADKTFLHCHCREGKTNEHLLLCSSSYTSCQRKIFLVKTSLLNLSPEGHHCLIESLQDFTLVFRKEK